MDEQPAYPDLGLDSVADRKILLRLLVFGLVGVVVAGFVAFIFSGNWLYVALIIGPYLLIAISQWIAASQRARRTRREAGAA